MTVSEQVLRPVSTPLSFPCGYHPGALVVHIQSESKGRDPSLAYQCLFLVKSVLRSYSLCSCGIPKETIQEQEASKCSPTQTSGMCYG
jgi:hypothetical protein